MARSILRNLPSRCYRGHMMKRHLTGLVVSALLLVACGGSSKAPESAAAESTQPTTTEAPTPAQDAPQSEAGAKTTETKVEEAAPSGPECKKTEDCTIFADCCTCKAIPAAKPLPTPCESVCGSGESKCEVKGMTIANVACENERCVLKKK